MVVPPLPSRLILRRKGLPGIAPKHRTACRTEQELTVELLGWAKLWLGLLKPPTWVVSDEASR